MRFHSVLRVPILVSLLGAGCAFEGGEGVAADDVGAQQEPLRITRRALAFEYTTRDDMPTGLAADLRYVFVAEALTGRVVALNRFSGREIAALEAPPDGAFILPFALRVTAPGHLAVLDPGGFPNPAGPPPNARIIEYEYRTVRGRFQAEHVRTISMAGLPIIFADDFTRLDDGSYVVVEPVIGAIWRVTPDGVTIPAVFPASPAPQDTIPSLGPCFAPPDLDVDGVPFQAPGDFLPGVASVTNDDDYLYFGSTCAGGLYRLPLGVLDDARPPFARAADIQLLSPRPSASALDSLKGLSIDIYGDPDYLYAADPFNVRVVRIDLRNGARQVVMQDGDLFNFVVSTTFLPPLGWEPASLVTVSDQEHRWTMLNAALTEDEFELPFVMTRLLPFR
jgi:hypothetical protein